MEYHQRLRFDLCREIARLQKSGMTRAAIAQKAGVSRTTLWRLENNTRWSAVSFDTMLRISDNLSPYYRTLPGFF